MGAAVTTIGRKQLAREMRASRLAPDPEELALMEEIEEQRPQTRGDCVNAPRPCVFVSCKHNLYLDVNADTGSIKLNFPDKELQELTETCALDVAEKGGVTLEVVGSLMNITRERIRQIEEESTGSLRLDLIDFQPLPAKEKLPLSPERRTQLRAAKKKYRQGNGRQMTNAARRRAYERMGK